MSSGAYTIESHLRMVADRVRMEAYHKALEAAIRPGCVVADIGTGTGIFAVLASRLGARRVYAIEPDTVMEIARQVVADNGLADQIDLIPGLSTSISLPERVDVVVSDVRGILPWYGRAISTVIDARERFLAKGGRLIPARDYAWAALAEVEEPYGYNSAALNDLSLGVDMSTAAAFTRNSWRGVDLAFAQLRTDPQLWTTVDYEAVTSTRANGQLSWTVQRAASANGLSIWFDTELIDGVQLSNAPGEPTTIYGQAFFPLEAPLELSPGDHVAVDIEGVLVADDYAWRWSTQVTAADGSTKATFEQSTIRSAPVPLSRLRRREAGYRATLSDDGDVDRLVLSSMDGATPLSDIARRLTDSFPDLFADEADALRRVAQLSERYSR